MSAGRNSKFSRALAYGSDANTFYDTDKPLATTHLSFKGTDYNYRIKGAGGANQNLDTIDAPPTNSNGHILILEGADSTATVTVRDDQAGTNIKLGGSARVLGDGDVLELRYQHDGFWHEFGWHPREGSGGGRRTVTATVNAAAGGTGQTAALFTIPANAILWDVHSRVATVFNGDTTTTFEVGVSGNTDAYIDPSDFNPTSSGLQLSNRNGTNNDVKSAEYSATARSLIATWTNTASATTGSIVVTADYSVLD